MATKSIPSIFEGRAEAASAYEELISFAKSLGRYGIEEKKTCIHLTAGKTAFLGVHPRKAGLRLTVVLSRPIESKRIVKCEKASINRYHIDLDVAAGADFDDELKGWIRESYQRSVARS